MRRALRSLGMRPSKSADEARESALAEIRAMPVEARDEATLRAAEQVVLVLARAGVDSGVTAFRTHLSRTGDPPLPRKMASLAPQIPTPVSSPATGRPTGETCDDPTSSFRRPPLLPSPATEPRRTPTKPPDASSKETLPQMPVAEARLSAADMSWLNEESASVRATETSLELPPQALNPVEKNKALLRVVTGFNAGQVLTIESHETVIGRGRDAQVRMEDAGVSRAHTKIVQMPDGRFMVEDMGSTNGTFVRGKRIDRVEVRAGDQIAVGPNVVLSFALVDESEVKLEKQLFESSTKDALTKCFNRKYFIERLQSEVAYAIRHKTRLALVLFDLDHFKKVNDTHGHLAGDEVLRAVSGQVGKIIRSEDVLARYGGEEFVVVVRGIEHANVALLAERVRRTVEKTLVAWEGATLRPTISVGVASLEECPRPAGDAILALADERLYRAKSEGRNRVCS